MSPILLAVIAIFTVLIFACLLVPIRMQLILNERRRSVVVSWFRMALGSNVKERVYEFKFFDQTIVRKTFKKAPSKEMKKKRRKPRKEIKEGKKKSRFNLRFLWEERDLLQRVTKIGLRFLRDILRAIRWDRLFLELQVSTPDPALTGVLYGELLAVKYSTEYSLPNARIKVEPDFVNQAPRGSVESVFSLTPLDLATSLSKMFFAMPKIRVVKTFLSKRRR